MTYSVNKFSEYVHLPEVMNLKHSNAYGGGSGGNDIEKSSDVMDG